MKISNYSGAADLFTFPYNSTSLDDEINMDHSTTHMPYQDSSHITSGGGITPKKLVLQGHFSGSSKLTSYRSLAKHFSEDYKLKKFYFESDKFWLGVGKQCKRTHSGGRTNFIDYVALFEPIVGVIFGDTQRTSGTNEGNIPTYVEEITGTVTSGASDIVLSDGTNEITIPAASLTTGQAIVFNFVKMVTTGGGIYTSEPNYVSVAGTQINTVQATGGNGRLKLAATANVTTITTTNLTSAVKKFRDGWIA